MKNDVVSRPSTTPIVEPARAPTTVAAERTLQIAPATWLLGISGVLLVAIAYAGARQNGWWVDLVFWAGLLAVFAPATLRMLRDDITRAERVGLVLLVGIGLYLVKLLHSPQSFTFYDELLHYRTATDLLASGQLFERNPLLPISSSFPGMHIMTSALAELGGLSIFQAGAVVILMARIAMVLALYVFYERLGASARVAGIGTLLYCANPAFLFFNGQYAYESFALALVPLALYAQARLIGDERQDRMSWYIVLWMTIGTIVISHQLTTYFLLLMLAVWSLFPLLIPGSIAVLRAYSGEISGRDLAQTLRARFADLGGQLFRRTAHMRDPGPARTLVLTFVASIVWTILVAGAVYQYLGSYALTSANELFQVLIGELEARRLFKGFTGEVAPPWEQFAGYAAVLLVLGLLPLGLHQIWKHHRSSQLALALAIVALIYPASQLIRFSDLGLQIAGRSVEFLFIPIAFVIAIWLANPTLPRIGRVVPRAAVAGAIVTIFVGGIILGWPRWARLPRPYIVSAETRSIEPQSLAAAAWAAANLPPDQRFAADRINGVLAGAYGGQYLVSLSYDGVNVPQMFMAPQFDVEELKVLREGRIDYIVVDRRLTTSPPISGLYFELGEENANRHTTPLATRALDKFGRQPFLSRVYVNGPIEVYAVNRERLP